LHSIDKVWSSFHQNCQRWSCDVRCNCKFPKRSWVWTVSLAFAPFKVYRSGTADLLLASPVLELCSPHLWALLHFEQSGAASWPTRYTVLHQILFGAIDLAEARWCQIGRSRWYIPGLLTKFSPNFYVLSPGEFHTLLYSSLLTAMSWAQKIIFTLSKLFSSPSHLSQFYFIYYY
jgi:hypothetical protein